MDKFPRGYMFFGTRSPNLTSILKPEVELVLFLRMHSDKITKNGETCPKNAVLKPIVCVYICLSVRGIRI